MNKHIKSLWLLPLAGLSLSLMPSCTTDSYGNSTVTPGGAAAIGVGALAAGAAIGAAVQHDRDKDRYRNDWHHHNPPPPPPRPPRPPHRPTAPIGGGKGKPMARKSCGAPALQEERGATWYFRSPVSSQDWRMPRSAQVMRCLALSGSLRMEPSRSSTGRTAFGSCTWSCPERIKGAPPQQTR